MAIPKIIHWVWVGPAPKPKLVLDCIESWKKFCPDYEIRLWGDEELAQIGNRFAIEALEHRKFAFASDVLRLYALKNYGGVYVDSDLQITAPIDRFLENHFFSGFENLGNVVWPITALMGAEKGNEIISDLLAGYDDVSFVNPDGSFKTTPNTIIISEYFEKRFGVVPPYDGNKTVELSEGNVIYPSYFFCKPEEGRENYSIHLFNGSWVNSYSRKSYGKMGRVEFVRFRRERRGRVYPLQAGERLLLLIPTRLSGRKKLAVIWK
jgi:hypothetical protein